jgi:hypothetical protein
VEERDGYWVLKEKFREGINPQEKEKEKEKEDGGWRRRGSKKEKKRNRLNIRPKSTCTPPYHP